MKKLITFVLIICSLALFSCKSSSCCGKCEGKKKDFDTCCGKCEGKKKEDKKHK